MSVNTTHSNSSSDSKVALFSPFDSPAVFDDPIILSVFSSISNQENGMIETLRVAVFRVEDARFVELQSLGIDKHWHRSVKDQWSCDFVFILAELLPILNLDCGSIELIMALFHIRSIAVACVLTAVFFVIIFGFARIASSGSNTIRVVLFSQKSLASNYILVSQIWPASKYSAVSFILSRGRSAIAVNQLFFG